MKVHKQWVILKYIINDCEVWLKYFFNNIDLIIIVFVYF